MSDLWWFNVSWGKCWGNKEFPSTVSLCEKREGRRWPGVGGVSLGSRRCSATLSYWGGKEGGVQLKKKKGQPMGLYKACGKSCVKRPWSLSSTILSAWRCSDWIWWWQLKSKSHVRIVFWSLKTLYINTCLWNVFSLGWLQTMCRNIENRVAVIERQRKPERKHNSRALLNKKSVAINSKPSSQLQHCFRFRRPGFSSSSHLMVGALQNHTLNPHHFLFLFSLLFPRPRYVLCWIWAVYVMTGCLCTWVCIFQHYNESRCITVLRNTP